MNEIKRADYTTKEYAEILVDGKAVGKIMPNKPVKLPEGEFTVSAYVLLLGGEVKIPLQTGKIYKLKAKPKPKPRKKAVKNETA